MSKSKNYREKENDRVHGKYTYRKRLLEEQEADQEVIHFAPSFGMAPVKQEGQYYSNETVDEYIKGKQD